MAEARILLGVVAAPHGVRGLVRIRTYTEEPMAIASGSAVNVLMRTAPLTPCAPEITPRHTIFARSVIAPRS